MSEYESGPFGESDGSRADLVELLEGFVRFDKAGVWGGLATERRDRSARIIVGRKGSGKTLYLRRLRAAANDEGSLYVDEIGETGLSTESVIKFCDEIPSDFLSEKWEHLWRKAIMLSVMSHMLRAPKLTAMCPEGFHEQIRRDFKRIVPDYVTPVSVYNVVTHIIEMYNTRNRIDRYFNDPLWASLEWIIKNNIQSFPPLCFYMDAVDQEFEKAPMYWLKCQVGLFDATMSLLRDSIFGGRLLIFVAIRNLVLTSVMRSTHATRFLSERHIRTLTWNKKSILYLLQRKIEMLPDDFFLKDSANGKNIQSWLGRTNFYNIARKTTEPMEQYLLRHTRFLPRDVIVLGNALCEAVRKYKNDPNGEQLDTLIREAVSDRSRYFGNEQLRICCKQIVSDQMPPGAGRDGYSGAFTGVEAYARDILDELKETIQIIGKDRFSLSEMKSARREAKKKFGEETDAFSVLWQNGLLGYVSRREDSETHVFYSDYNDELRLPEIDGEYVLHSCIIDSVGVKSVGDVPVY
jgi:hypothetical protein